ncbi:hypothetical protein QUB05_12315 [Microcoleus sp. F10-C6]|uniref:hypothetical protein n=1 Tax=unclassified Microcoleus TaxID=2642155 RepID=UPI002FD49E00
MAQSGRGSSHLNYLIVTEIRMWLPGWADVARRTSSTIVLSIDSKTRKVKAKLGFFLPRTKD